MSGIFKTIQKILNPSAGAQSAALTAQTQATQSAAQRAAEAWGLGEPLRKLFGGYVAGTTPASALPGWMQTPDWRSAQNEVYNAYNWLGNTKAADLYRQNAAAVNQANLRRGFVGPNATASLPDLLNWYESTKAEARADALSKSLATGQALRGEAGTNWMDMLKFVTNPEGSAADINVAGAYGNLASSLGGQSNQELSSLAGLLQSLQSIFPNIYKPRTKKKTQAAESDVGDVTSATSVPLVDALALLGL